MIQNVTNINININTEHYQLEAVAPTCWPPAAMANFGGYMPSAESASLEGGSLAADTTDVFTSVLRPTY